MLSRKRRSSLMTCLSVTSVMSGELSRSLVDCHTALLSTQPFIRRWLIVANLPPRRLTAFPPSETFAERTTGAQPPAGHDAPGAASALQAKDDVYNALDVIEALRVQLVGYLDVDVGCSGDFECKACGRKFKEPQRKVPGVGIVIVCLDIADTSVIVLELTLHDEIVAVVHRGIEIINTRGLAVERDLEVLVAGLSDGHVFRVKSHGGQPCCSACQSILSQPRLPEVAGKLSAAGPGD